MTPEQLASLTTILQSLHLPAGLPPADLHRWVMMGAVLALEEDASGEAISLLRDAVITSPVPQTQELALRAIGRLAAGGHEAANRALFHLAVDRSHPGAGRLIQENSLTAVDPDRQVLFDFLREPAEEPDVPEVDLSLLTGAFLRSDQPSVRSRVLQAARQKGLEAWTCIAEYLADPSSERLDRVLDRYPGLKTAERALLLDQLEQLAGGGEETARTGLAEIALRFDEPAAARIAVDSQFAPSDPVRQALFFFLTEQWEAYERLDFTHALLETAFEAADTSLRQRILAHSRFTGQIGWLGSSRQGRLRWLQDLNHADWTYTINQLDRDQRYAELWKLAQSGPPVQAAAIVDRLNQAGFNPLPPGEEEDWEVLCRLARDASQFPPDFRPQRRMTADSPLLSLAASPDGRLLAAGTPLPLVHLWKLPDAKPLPALSGPVSQARALTFSPDRQTLACVGDDAILRVFRLSDHQLVKAMAGHTSLVRALEIHPDSKAAFTASFDGTLRAGRYPFGSELLTIRPGTGELFSLALSSGGNTLLAAGSGAVVHVVRWPEGVEVRRLEGASDAITSLAAPLDGQLAAGYSRDRMVHIWNHASGRVVQQIQVTGEPMTALAFHPDQQILFGADYGGGVHLWSTGSGQELAGWHGHKQPVTGLVYLEAEEKLFTSAGSEILQYDLSPFFLLHRPVSAAGPRELADVHDWLRQEQLLPGLAAWLEWARALLERRMRFDIQVEEPEVIQVGDFDLHI